MVCIWAKWGEARAGPDAPGGEADAMGASVPSAARRDSLKTKRGSAFHDIHASVWHYLARWRSYCPLRFWPSPTYAKRGKSRRRAGISTAGFEMF